MKHAPRHATALLAWPLLTILALHSKEWDDPILIAIMVALIFTFVVTVWAMLKVERSLNAEGESLVYPWRVPSTRKEARRIDGVLSTSIRRLNSGEDEVEVLATLRLHLEGRLHGEAGRHYRRAMERLRDAAGRDWVFDKDRRERALEEAERALWMARAEFLKEKIV